MWLVLQHGSSAASLAVAEQYVQAFGRLAKRGNTLLLPERTGDVGSMVAQVCCQLHLVPTQLCGSVQAMAIYGQMTSQPLAGEGEEEEGEDEGEVELEDKLKDITAEATRDLDNVLSQLTDGIRDLGSDRTTGHEQPRPADPPHFTLASSPTHRRATTEPSAPPTDTTIV